MVLIFVTKIKKRLSEPQKKLLHWHWNLVFRMYRIHEMMHEQNMEYLSVVTTLLFPVINLKYKSTTNCVVPACDSFQLDHSKERINGIMKQNLFEGK